MAMLFIIVIFLLLSWFVLSTRYSSIAGNFIIKHIQRFLTGKYKNNESRKDD